jgi:hypothetical protein
MRVRIPHATGLSSLLRAAWIAGAICLFDGSPAIAAEDETWWSRGYTVEAFAGAVTTRLTHEIILGEATFNKGGLVAIVGSKELVELGGGFAIRGQLLADHRFDGLDYDEFAFMLGMEYSDFPWSESWPTTLEVSTGPSYATRLPKIEDQTSGDPQRWLNAVGLELSVAPSPDSHWSIVGRYHHRSSAFGLYGGNQDESTAFAAGIKYRF